MAKQTHTAHRHLLRALATEMAYAPAPARPWRILDAGCGDGKLIVVLSQGLAAYEEFAPIEIYGLDVSDSGVQARNYHLQTIARLRGELPEVVWEPRIRIVSSREAWPFPSAFFDAVVSNQVIEHVRDHDRFFAEIKRTLRAGGISVHLFPLANSLIDWHLRLPFVHRIGNHDLLRAVIGTLSLMGLGKYRSHRAQFGMSRRRFAEYHADYMLHHTNYPQTRELFKCAKRQGLRASFRYTAEFYREKLRGLVGVRSTKPYRRRGPLAEWMAAFVFRYVACVTMVLENRDTYPTRLCSDSATAAPATVDGRRPGTGEPPPSSSDTDSPTPARGS